MERITICRDSKTSNDDSYNLDDDFHGYELLLLKRLQSDPVVCVEWREKLLKKVLDDSYDLGEIPHNLWYLAITLDRKKLRFLNFVHNQVKHTQEEKLHFCRDTLLMKYLNSHMFTELHLDGIFKYGDDNTLPKEIFRCPSVRILSMKYNYLNKIPPDIGRMQNLEYLALTNNKLQNKSLPYTLAFCCRLKTLMLDNNNLDALPGFMLTMDSLQTVYRHGNHNYFKSTFMWYHTDVNERILRICGVNDRSPHQPESLQFFAAKAIIGSKVNFFSEASIAPVLKDFIVDVYHSFNVCGLCNTAKLTSHSGYKVITFKNPYLGNTCVPFQHWACSETCATAIEIPARREQIEAASQLDQQYDKYVESCQRQYSVVSSERGKFPLRRSRRRAGVLGIKAGLSAPPDTTEVEEEVTGFEEIESVVKSSTVPRHFAFLRKGKKSRKNNCVIS